MQKLRKRWHLAAAVILLPMLAGCATQLVTPLIESEPEAEAVRETESAAQDAKTAGESDLLPAEAPPFGTEEWRTDFSKRTVEWSDILSGGPPKDGIASIDNPSFESVAAASERLTDQDPVIVFEHEGDVRAYPLSILIWHEIVNDEVGGKPVSVTFCPLCNASIVFDREFDGQFLDFGTTGRLRNSDLIMYDRQSETWWQQFTGEGIVGEYAGRELDFLSSQVLSFGDFAAMYPDGQVLAVPTNFNRSYGANPYTGYDSSARPFLFDGNIDERLPALERVVGVELGGTVTAYAFDDVAQVGAINDVAGETPLVIFHKPGTASALDTRTISEGRDIGSVGVFNRNVDGQMLTFSANGDGTFSDNETNSTWSITGEAIDGELVGTQMEAVISFDHFWFAWAAFFPETGVYGG